MLVSFVLKKDVPGIDKELSGNDDFVFKFTIKPQVGRSPFSLVLIFDSDKFELHVG